MNRNALSRSATTAVAALAALLVSGCSSSKGDGASAPDDGRSRAVATPSADPAAAITVDAIAGPLSFLSDDLLEGRGPGTRGDLLSQAYLASRFREAGLKPLGAGGGYVAPVKIKGMTATVVAPLAARGPGGELTFAAPSDFVAFAERSDETLAWSGAEIVFVGYGITAPEQRWDDFKDVDVKGKVLLVMNDDPSSDPSLFAGKTRLYYGRWTYKFEEAARRGAAGAIVIHTTPSAGYPFQVIQSNHEQERFSLPTADEPAMAISSWVSEDAAKKIARLGGHDLDVLRAAAESRDFRPVALGVETSLRLRNVVRTFDSGNVVGVLPGSDPKLRDEYVVVTAHFDHLGRGPAKNGDDVYNGALDNASGCAAMLAILDAAAKAPTPPRRSLMFLAVTGEESGLLGSDSFARNPPVPNAALVANYNIDGVNIWGRARDVQMIGHGKSDLSTVVESAAAARGRTVKPDSEPDKGLFYRSDHFSFARVGVPSVYLKSGTDFLEDGETKRSVQLSYTAVRYHQPSDQFDARWDLRGAVDDMRLLYDAMMKTANADSRPKWTPGDEFERARP